MIRLFTTMRECAGPMLSLYQYCKLNNKYRNKLLPNVRNSCEWPNHWKFLRDLFRIQAKIILMLITMMMMMMTICWTISFHLRRCTGRESGCKLGNPLTLNRVLCGCRVTMIIRSGHPTLSGIKATGEEESCTKENLEFFESSPLLVLWFSFK